METIKRTKIVDVLKSDAFGTTVNVKGWVRTRRGSKQVNFIALNNAWRYRLPRLRSSVRLIPLLIRCRKRDTPWSFYVRSLTCVLVRIHLARYSVFVTIWLTLSISFSMIEAFSISIRRSSRLPTVRVPDRCSKLLPRICTT